MCKRKDFFQSPMPILDMNCLAMVEIALYSQDLWLVNFWSKLNDKIFKLVVACATMYYLSSLDLVHQQTYLSVEIYQALAILILTFTRIILFEAISMRLAFGSGHYPILCSPNHKPVTHCLPKGTTRMKWFVKTIMVNL